VIEIGRRRRSAVRPHDGRGLYRTAGSTPSAEEKTPSTAELPPEPDGCGRERSIAVGSGHAARCPTPRGRGWCGSPRRGGRAPRRGGSRQRPLSVSVGSRAVGRRAGDRSRTVPAGISRCRGTGARWSTAGLFQIVWWRPRATRRTRVLRDDVRGCGVSSRRSEVDRDLLGVTGADRRGATLIPAGSNHLPSSVEKQFPRLLDRAPRR
jgi:hypothetical protein